MTEYDFSPEAYQAHLENMNRISRWVDRTEGHRAEFGNAAALIEDQRGRTIRNSSPSHSPERRNGFGGRRRKSPSPLPLHAYGTPDMMYVATPYPSSIHPADGFFYGRSAGSPGTMPMYGPGYQVPPMPHTAGAQAMMPPIMSPALVSLTSSLPYHHHRHSRSGRVNSYSLMAPLSGGYVQAVPNVMILSSRHHKSGRHRNPKPVSYVYV